MFKNRKENIFFHYSLLSLKMSSLILMIAGQTQLQCCHCWLLEIPIRIHLLPFRQDLKQSIKITILLCLLLVQYLVNLVIALLVFYITHLWKYLLLMKLFKIFLPLLVCNMFFILFYFLLLLYFFPSLLGDDYFRSDSLERVYLGAEIY